MIAGIGAVIFIKLGTVLALVPLILIWYVIFIAQIFSDIPFAALEIESYWIIWIGFAIILGSIFQKSIIIFIRENLIYYFKYGNSKK